MKVFMLKCLGIAALMFISVLAGMQIANDGIHKMKGSNDPNFQGAIFIKEKGPNLSFSEKNPVTHDFEAKQKKLEEISSFNIFSEMGKKLSDGISNASEKLVKSITK